MDLKPRSALVCLFLLGWALIFVIALPQQDAQTNGIPRSSRGSFQMQNSKLSTARGFGKRDGGTFSQVLLPGSSFDDNLQRNVPVKSIYPYSRLIDEIQTNPEILRNIMERLNDMGGEGELTLEASDRRY